MKPLYLLAPFFLLLAWLVPDHYHPWGAFYNDYLAFLALILLFVAEYRTNKNISVFFALLLIALLSIVVQFIVGIYHFHVDAAMAAVYLLAAFAAYQVGLSVPGNQDLIKGLAILFVAGSLITALIGISQWLGASSTWIYYGGDYPPSGNLAQSNNYATLLLWGLCGLAYLLLTRMISVWFYVFVGAVLALGVVVSESRTPILQVGFLLVWFLLAFSKKLMAKQQLTVLVPLVLFGVAYLFFPYIDSILKFEAAGEVGLVEKSYSSRIAIWASMITALAESGWLGYGWGQVSVAQFLHLGSSVDQVALSDHSHNIVIDILIWAGPVFGLLIIGFASFWVGRQFVQVRSLGSWFLMACVGVLLIHANLEFPLEYAYFLLPFFLMLGLVDNEQGRGRPLRVNKTIFQGLVLLPAITLMTVVWREYRVLEEDHRLMRAQNFGLQVDLELRLSKHVQLIDGERDYIRFARTPAAQGLSAGQLDWMRKVTYRYPFAVLIYRYSVALELNGFADEARQELKKIKILYGEKQYEYYKFYAERSVELGHEA